MLETSLGSLSLRFPTGLATNQVVQQQNLDRGLKFLIEM